MSDVIRIIYFFIINCVLTNTFYQLFKCTLSTLVNMSATPLKKCILEKNEGDFFYS